MSRILADGVMAMLRSASVQRIRLVLGVIRMAKKTAENMSPQRRRALKFLCNQDTELLEPKIVEAEKVLNGLIRALRDNE